MKLNGSKRSWRPVQSGHEVSRHVMESMLDKLDEMDIEDARTEAWKMGWVFDGLTEEVD